MQCMQKNFLLVILAVYFWPTFSKCGPLREETVSTNIVDLSYPFDNTTIYWPSSLPSENVFNLSTIFDGPRKDGSYYRSKKFQTPEHGGTHLDAPSHFNKNGIDAGQIPVEQLVGPVAIINVSDHVQSNPDYQVTVEDVKEWEKQHGQIPEGCFVFMFSNWGTRWPDKKLVFGTNDVINASTFHFPGFHPNTTSFLIDKRNIKGVGVDTPSTDHGQAGEDFGTHVALATGNRVGLENVAHLEKMPATGGRVFVFPIKISDGSGAPARIIGMY